ncbi:MAG TPA: hypothetical protein VEI82_11450 [Myxococcota bacterium]|nr:hypothetical protein [Myxococcota bacterium]
MRREARKAVDSLQRAALLALLALASHLLLPYVHVLSSACSRDAASCSSEQTAPTHSQACSVCGALAHSGARALDAPLAAAAAPLEVAALAAPHAPAPLAPAAERDVAPARGPPVSSPAA